jgi:transposase
MRVTRPTPCDVRAAGPGVVGPIQTSQERGYRPNEDMPTGQFEVIPNERTEETPTMLVLGIDAHKRSHTIVAVDDRARKLAERTINATTDDHLALIAWAQALGDDRLWAVEDCRHLSRRLERDLLGAGERVVRVPTKMMAGTRKKSRDYGKSDPIDALAVARAALQEPDLPAAQLDGPARDVRLLVDHREDLVAERTRIISRLRWHLHELNPTWDPPVCSFDRAKTVTEMTANLAGLEGTVARLARRLLERCSALTAEIKALDAEMLNSSPSSLRRCSRSVGAGRSPQPRSSARPPTSAGSVPRTPTPATTGPPRSRCGRPTIPATASAGSGTVNSTARSTASRSPKPTGTPKPAPTSSGAKTPVTQAKKPSEPSNAGSPTSSTEPSSPTPTTLRPPPPPKYSAEWLDIGASYRPLPHPQSAIRC